MTFSLIACSIVLFVDAISPAKYSPDTMTPHIARRLLILAVVVGTILRFWGIESRSLWGDEIASLAFATGHHYFPWDEDTDIIQTANYYRAYVLLAPDYFSQRLLSVLQKDTQLPFYYTLLNLWLHLFGTSEIALRSVSVAASIASIPLVYAVACAIGSSGIAAYAALLFAVAPFQIAFAQYNRPYAWLGFFSLLSGLAALNICRGVGGWRWFVTYGVATAFGLYTHYLFIWNLPFHCTLVFLYNRRTSRSFLLRWVLLLGCIGGSFLPWIPVFVSQLNWNRESSSLTWFYWATGCLPLSSTVLHLGRNLVTLLSVGRVQGLCSSFQEQGCYADAVLTGVYYGMPILLLSWCIWRFFFCVYNGSAERNHWLNSWSICLLWGFCVAAGVVILDITLNSRSVRFPQYFIAASGALYIAVATSFTFLYLRSRGLWILLGSLVFLLSGSVLYLNGFSTLIYEQGMRDVAEHLDQNATDKDLILVLNPGPNPIDLAYYLKSDPAFGMVNIPGRWRSSLDISAQLEKLKRGRKRLWYLDDLGPEIRARSLLLTWLRTHQKEIEVKKFKNLDLFLFSLL